MPATLGVVRGAPSTTLRVVSSPVVTGEDLVDVSDAGCLVHVGDAVGVAGDLGGEGGFHEVVEVAIEHR